MSRLNELKKQYPELNITIIDILCRLDNTKSHKYLALLCKLFGERLNFKRQNINSSEYAQRIKEIRERLQNLGIDCESLSTNQMYFIWLLSDHFSHDLFTTFNEFSELMEKGLIENKDVTSYGSVDEMRGAITLASLKEFTKEMENQVVKEYEDETWVIVRPLTFLSSLKYGAGTKWCTTSRHEKQYFERYWRQGILVYFINKKSGYKFAGYRDLDSRELSFWNAEDQRIDFLDVKVDDYLFSTVCKIFKSTDTNKNLCSAELQEQVHQECLIGMEKKSELRVVDEPIPQPVEEYRDYNAELEHLYRNETEVPIFESPNIA
jgi:hypothetical protein